MITVFIRTESVQVRVAVIGSRGCRGSCREPSWEPGWSGLAVLSVLRRPGLKRRGHRRQPRMRSGGGSVLTRSSTRPTMTRVFAWWRISDSHHGPPPHPGSHRPDRQSRFVLSRGGGCAGFAGW